jgi:hypothetical protein
MFLARRTAKRAKPSVAANGVVTFHSLNTFKETLSDSGVFLRNVQTEKYKPVYFLAKPIVRKSFSQGVSPFLNNSGVKKSKEN